MRLCLCTGRPAHTTSYLRIILALRATNVCSFSHDYVSILIMVMKCLDRPCNTKPSEQTSGS